MAGTPKRKSIAASTASPAVSLIGSAVVIPPEIFAEDDVQYTGKVIGTPSRRKNAVYVKVDQDATQYWFPVSEVSKWVVDNKPATRTSTPKSARHKRKHTAEPSQQVPTASQTADADDQAVTQAAAPRHLALSDSPAAAVHLHDASSSHPQPQEDFTDTIEGLVSPCRPQTASPGQIMMLQGLCQHSAFCRQQQALRSCMTCLQQCKLKVGLSCCTCVGYRYHAACACHLCCTHLVLAL